MVEDEGEQDFVDVQRERGEVCEAGEGLAEGCEEGDWGEEGIEHFFRGGFGFWMRREGEEAWFGGSGGGGESALWGCHGGGCCAIVVQDARLVEASGGERGECRATLVC